MPDLPKFRPLQNRRARRITRRRAEIAEAAASLFAEKGFAATTTKDIAAAADIAEGTLYNYFKNKREILLFIVSAMQQALLEVLGEAGVLEREEDVIALVEKQMDLFLSHLDFTRTLIAEVWLDDDLLHEILVGRLRTMRQAITDFITSCVDKGIFRPVDPQAASSMLIGMFVVPILPALRGVKDLPTHEERHAIAETVVSVFLDGVRIRV